MSTEDFKAQALRIAAEIVSEAEGVSYDDVVGMVAGAYMRGLIDGHQRASDTASEILRATKP